MLRHEGNELDWTTILIFHLLRIESEQFTNELIERVFDENDDFDWMRWALSQQQEEEEEIKFNDFADGRFKSLDDKTRQRLKWLVSVWREKRAFHFKERLKYQISFAARPRHVT